MVFGTYLYLKMMVCLKFDLTEHLVSLFLNLGILVSRSPRFPDSSRLILFVRMVRTEPMALSQPMGREEVKGK